MTTSVAEPVADEDGFTEIRDAEITNVDAVGAAANGTQWFFAKQAEGGLVPAELVRELIGEPAPEPVRVVGPAALIHNAPVRKAETAAEEVGDVAKAKLSSAEMNDLPDSAFAYIEPGGTKDDEGKTTPRSKRHFAIHDKAHADNAAARIAQGAEFGDKAKPKVEAAQRKFGESVSKADEPQKADSVDVEKADDTEAAGDGPDLDVTTVMAEPDPGAGGSPDVPGSPVWEATDAATARKWSAILARAKIALETLSDREALEAATADPSDIEDSWDLQDAACAIDYALGILAPFAIGEQIEAEAGDMVAVGKALAAMDPDAPDTLAFLAKHTAAGPLSEPNAEALREAAGHLRKALAALPREKTADPDPAPEVAKADGSSVVAVYDAHGVLFGVVDPGDITPVAPATAKDTGDEMTEPKDTAPEGATTTDAALIPGTQTVASPPKTADDDEKVQKAVQAALAPLTEAVAELAKQVSQGADVAGAVDVLKERVEQLAKMPDDRNSPLQNGATGTPGVADRNGAVADPYAELTKAVADATTPAQKLDAEQKLAYAKVRDRFTR